MRLRPFRAADLDTLYQIDQVCFPPGVSYSRQELDDFIHDGDSTTWVAESDADLVGFLVANREPPHAAHIITIDVVEEWRRRGVGRALMDAAEAWAGQENLAVIYLETAVDNTVAQRFYESRGYERFRRLEHYYNNGAAAWIMVKRLKKGSPPAIEG
ncbi:MAG TPA: N-acetyltransferase [Terriglobia bacterium]|nr:N-acetyltransferase [Terriglobia bacterium]